MSNAREVQLAALVLDLRAPLARVGLAASQLLRDGATPASRDLAAGIEDAVSEMDGGIERTLTLLAPPRMRCGSLADGSVVLDELRERMEGVLRAGGIVWDDDDSAVGVPGDPVQIRHAAVGLLRGARGLAPKGGHIRLGLRDSDGCPSLRLALAREPGAKESDRDPWQDARLFALTSGGALEVRESPTGVEATLWLSPGHPS